MSYFRTTRTVRTIRSDGSGPPRTDTKTYTYGGDGGSGDTGSSGIGGMDFGNFGREFGKMFPGFGGKISIGGGDDEGSSGRGGRGYGGGHVQTQRPRVVGRPSRKEKKNPFSGVLTQSFEEIKKKCLEEGVLFEDPEFPAEDGSIFFSKSPPRPFEWKRPTELVENAEFISEGASRFDVQQGELGDCWLLAAVASLTINKHLFNRVVQCTQNFTDDYCGVFCFNFWHQGDWVEVIVDDRLPTYYDQLVFMHSTEKNEFWSALLEKAYAKLMGSYESLKGGSTSEAMEDFTGGVTEMFDLRQAPANIFKIMTKAHERGALMGCSIDADPSNLEARLDNGLVMGHAYSVTGVRMIDITTPRSSGKIQMVRVRNPWGNEAEWTGAWSDQSREWQFIPEDQKSEIGLTFDDDGEFWMAFNDFSSNFQKLEVCNLGPESHSEEDEAAGKKKWVAQVEGGEWIPRVNAGGCRNYLETFWTNPQYRVTLTDPDDDDDDETCTMIVGVLQKDRRKKRKEGLDMLTMGYVIYKLTDDAESGPMDVKFFKYNASVAKSPSFINLREVAGRHKLVPGTYVVIPSTFEPHQKGEFLIRIFTEKDSVASEMDEQTTIVDDESHRTYAAPPSMSQQDQRGRKGRSEPTEPNEQEQEQEEALKGSFRRVAGEDMEIDAYELQEILNSVFTKEFTFDGFGLDTCRSMVAMHDGDLSGKLGYDEFKTLWTDLRKWKGKFKEFDHDSSGKLSSYELRKAMNASGFRLSNRTYSALVMRYSDKTGNVDFGDFILCAIRLKTMIASFKMLDPEKQGIAAFDVEHFIQTTMYS